jgi:hypothetical protein
MENSSKLFQYVGCEKIGSDNFKTFYLFHFWDVRFSLRWNVGCALLCCHDMSSYMWLETFRGKLKYKTLQLEDSNQIYSIFPILIS